MIPGVLFWVALIYTGLGTAVTHSIGRSLTNLYFAQQRFEANFRFGLARAREYSEQIALLNGESCETNASDARFGDVYGNYMRIVKVRKWLTAFTRSYGQASVLIPYVVAAPFYFLGKISMGALNQVGAAFNAVNESMNFFVTYYIGLADFRATFERLASFDEAIARAEEAGARAPHALVAPAAATDIAIDDLSLRCPTAAPWRASTISPSPPASRRCSSGRRDRKVDAVSRDPGMWPYGRARSANRPTPSSCCCRSGPTARSDLCARRSLIPRGTAFSRREAARALIKVGLPALADQLDDTRELADAAFRRRAAAPRSRAGAVGRAGLAVSRRGDRFAR